MAGLDLRPWQSPEVIQAALSVKRIAVVGLSNNPARDSHQVSDYMRHFGYEIVPVNPNEAQIFGLPCFPSISAVPGAIDMVNVFRDSAAVPEIAEEAVAKQAHFFWTQLGVISPQGIEIAQAGGLTCVVDRCLKIEHARYQHLLDT